MITPIQAVAQMQRTLDQSRAFAIELAIDSIKQGLPELAMKQLRAVQSKLLEDVHVDTKH